MRTSPARPSEARGAVLITALIILLLMSIISISAMQGAVIEERMAGNMKEQQRAFQAAEAGLRAGESYAASNLPSAAFEFDYAGMTPNSLNADEIVPEYGYTLSAPSVRELTDSKGETATSAKGATQKLYTRRYTVDANGRVGEEGAFTTLRSSYVAAGF